MTALLIRLASQIQVSVLLSGSPFCLKPFQISSTNPIGILGAAGASGLYAALILQDLGIPYRIIEAQGKVGGRLFMFEL
ncbi:hypothetical protein P692DRAFT_20884016 [Suillus brevipes Sb2]|nr:hypothetical protein P692DRAFT_20884016 [Suillus brevipes Sb2]